MAMVVNHNIPALSTYNVVNATSSALSKSIQKLSTGLRINSAADDAAGLAISEKMRAQINGLSKAIDNSQDAISMLQTAEGALTETHSILQRMRELSVQAANDTLTAQDRSYIQLEIDQLRDEITNIGDTTQFNTKKLLNGDAAVLWSASDNSTKAIINGGLRKIDQFGQKKSTEANYKIEITATPGEAQAQKTDILKIKHQVVESKFDGTDTVTLSGKNGMKLDDDFVNAFAETSNTITVTVGITKTDVDNKGTAADATDDVTTTTSLTQTITITGADVKAKITGTDKGITALNKALQDKLPVDGLKAAADDGIKASPNGTDKIDIKVIAAANDTSVTNHTISYAIDSVAVEMNTIGMPATKNTQLRDIDKFWTTEGVFMLEDPQTITITQGDGEQASFTLYGTDTITDFENKLNTAIGTDLGQNAYLDSATSKFATFVDAGTAKTANDAATAKPQANSVAGTFVIRSAVAGKVGELNFAADEKLLNALSLNQIHASTETRYNVTVSDAHSGAQVANVNITGNELIGVIDENVDVEFDPMLGAKIKAKENNPANGYFKLNNDAGTYTTYLHLADNTTVFQVGANEGEDMLVNIGDMRSRALGLNKVLVTDRDSAARSITVIDNAIDRVSTQRAKIGAYQNRLEYKISNLTTSHQNLTSAESRIRDTDMAKEMMNMMKLQITLQAGTAMLAQANQLPQNVLSLIR